MNLRTTTIGAYQKSEYVKLQDWFDDPDAPDPTVGWVEAMDAQAPRSFPRERLATHSKPPTVP
ncbi:MAG: hypothetical protein CL911_02045 [Deltaproteobacteria bacterium]|nr:hypothetical protein [Deltaproteobacteria bacterium]